jgi:hypothetical protein
MKLPPKPNPAPGANLLAALAARDVLFVESFAMRVGEFNDPKRPDHPIRLVEGHLTLQDRDQKVIWLLDQELMTKLRDHFSLMLDPVEGIWVDKPEVPQDQTEQLRGAHTEGLTVDDGTLAEMEGTLPMGINRPEDAGEDGEFTYLKGGSENGEDQDD